MTTRRSAGWAGLAAAVAFVGGSLILFLGPARHFSVLGRAPTVAPFAVGAVVVLLVAGIAVTTTRPHWRSGRLLLLAACAACLPAWVGWEGSAPALRTLAAALATFVAPLIAHATATFPDGRARRRSTRAVLRAGYVVGVLTAAGARLLGVDPFRHVGCWATCAHNPLAVWVLPPGVFAALGCAAAGVLAGAGVLAVRHATSNHGSRGPRRLAALASGLAGIGLAVLTFAASRGSDDPARPEVAVAVGIFSAGAMMLGGAYLWAVVGAAVRQSRLRMLATDTPSGSLAATLGQALGDPSLTLSPAGSHEAAPNGAPADPVTRTNVQRAGRIVATLEHSADVVDLEAGIGPALRLALENEALDLELDLQLTSLRASRARIVAAGDDQRRRLERDLHDGAQQHLVVLAALLRGARQRSQQRGEVDACQLLDAAIDEARAALGDLRSLAHGIFPAVLGNDGLEAALRAMAISAALPLELDLLSTRRAPREVETALYLLTQAVAADAAEHGASHVGVRLSVGSDAAVLELGDDRTEPALLADHILDRVGAAGGSVEVSAGRVRAIIPLGRPVPTAAR